MSTKQSFDYQITAGTLAENGLFVYSFAYKTA